VATPVEVQTSKGDNDEEEKCMAVYSTATKGISEEDPADGFINDIRKK